MWRVDKRADSGAEWRDECREAGMFVAAEASVWNLSCGIMLMLGSDRVASRC